MRHDGITLKMVEMEAGGVKGKDRELYSSSVRGRSSKSINFTIDVCIHRELAPEIW